MSTVGAYEAKTHLARLLDEVARGESVTITKHGRPIARLVPVDPAVGAPADVIRQLREARRGLTARGSVRAMIEEGRA